MTGDVRNIQHHFSAGVYARQMNLPQGYSVKTHSHKYDHMSILAKGKVVIESGDITEVYSAPTVITIKANIEHGILALEDVTWFCIHGTDETDPTTLDEVLITHD